MSSTVTITLASRTSSSPSGRAISPASAALPPGARLRAGQTPPQHPARGGPERSLLTRPVPRSRPGRRPPRARCRALERAPGPHPKNTLAAGPAAAAAPSALSCAARCALFTTPAPPARRRSIPFTSGAPAGWRPHRLALELALDARPSARPAPAARRPRAAPLRVGDRLPPRSRADARRATLGSAGACSLPAPGGALRVGDRHRLALDELTLEVRPSVRAGACGLPAPGGAPAGGDRPPPRSRADARRATLGSRPAPRPAGRKAAIDTGPFPDRAQDADLLELAAELWNSAPLRAGDRRCLALELTLDAPTLCSAGACGLPAPGGAPAGGDRPPPRSRADARSATLCSAGACGLPARAAPPAGWRLPTASMKGLLDRACSCRNSFPTSGVTAYG
jgi:hypothetical protein